MSEQRPGNESSGFKGHPLIDCWIEKEAAGHERCPTCQQQLERMGGWVYQCRNLACSLGFDKRLLVKEEHDVIVHVV